MFKEMTLTPNTIYPVEGDYGLGLFQPSNHRWKKFSGSDNNVHQIFHCSPSCPSLSCSFCGTIWPVLFNVLWIKVILADLRNWGWLWALRALFPWCGNPECHVSAWWCYKMVGYHQTSALSGDHGTVPPVDLCWMQTVSMRCSQLGLL